MIDSLKNQGIDFKIWILCLSEKTKEIIDSVGCDEIETFSLEVLEKEKPELLRARTNRKISEYYFTLSPFWPRWLLENYSELKSITYLDSDLEFFSNPEILHQEVGSSSIGIIEHRFHPSADKSNLYGKFNVGWIYFKNDKTAIKCLEQWEKNCLNWCKDRPENGKFADQKYLDSWPDDFKNTHIIRNSGANIAPWNINSHVIKKEKDILISDNDKIVFYHFNIKAIDSEHLSTSLDNYKVPYDVKKDLIKCFYIPYVIKLLKKEKQLFDYGFQLNAFKSTRDYTNIDKHKQIGLTLDQRIKNGEVIRIDELKIT